MKKSRVFRSSSYLWGSQVAETHIGVYVPAMIKELLMESARADRKSMNRYIIDLIIADIRPKSKKLHKYLKELERVQQLERELNE